MNLLNSLGFFVVGAVMLVAAELAPAFVSFGALTEDTRELWLEFMGTLMLLIGSGCTARCLAAALPKSLPLAKVPAKATALANAHANSRSTLASTANRATA